MYVLYFFKELMSLLNRNQDLRQKVEELEEEILYYKAMLSVQENPASPDQQVPGLWTGEEDLLESFLWRAISQIFPEGGGGAFSLLHSQNSYKFIPFSQMFIFSAITFSAMFFYNEMYILWFSYVY